MSENERQVRLLQLWRQALLAGQEEQLELAARLLGLLERQDATREVQLKGDRARQTAVMRQRLASRRMGRAKEVGFFFSPANSAVCSAYLQRALQHMRMVELVVVMKSNFVSSQLQKISASLDKKQPKENLLKLIDAKHRQEESLLFSWIEAAPKAEKAQLLAGLSRPDLENTLVKLKAKHAGLGSSKKAERHMCLADGVHVRFAVEQFTGTELEAAKVDMLANLQSEQSAECNKLLNSITEWVRCRYHFSFRTTFSSSMAR